MDNLLHCLKHGCQLGWIIDPDHASIVVFLPQQEPDIYRGDRSISLIDSININLTPNQIFSWLKINNK